MTTTLTPKPLTIGVFDSGFGGLTVLRALLPLIPAAHYIYLGDTARLPYGSKSRETIARYAVSSARFLHQQGADLLVIACNTATALALEDIQHALPIPVIGVVEPGAQAALAISPTVATALSAAVTSSVTSDVAPAVASTMASNIASDKAVILSAAKDPCISPESPAIPTQNHVLVLATAATVQSRAYTHALNALNLAATEKACPLLVPLVEEGWINHPVTDEVLKIYLTEALTAAPATRTLLLGCTHYPLIEPAIHRTLAAIGHPLTLIDSADATARATATLVAHHFPNLPTTGQPTCTFYATDSIEKFQRLGSSFLGQSVAQVNLIDLGG
jgi:glutamate racemase